jgi:type VI secretion system protein VasD
MRLPLPLVLSVRTTTIAGATACALALAGCANNAEREGSREPVKFDLTIKAASSVNPDDQQRAAPIIVRLYELKSPDTFNTADFFSLQDKDKAVLGDDIAARDQFQLRPGDDKTIRRNSKPGTTTLGVIAEYRDLPRSVWRATWPLPPSPAAAWYHRGPKLKLTIDLDTNAIKITDPTVTDQ